jgi:hypothetical protein
MLLLGFIASEVDITFNLDIQIQCKLTELNGNTGKYFETTELL